MSTQSPSSPHAHATPGPTRAVHGSHPWWRTRTALVLGVMAFIGCSFTGGQRAHRPADEALPATVAHENGVAELVRRLPPADAGDGTANGAGGARTSGKHAATASSRTPRVAARKPAQAQAPRIVLSDQSLHERIPTSATGAPALTGLPAYALGSAPYSGSPQGTSANGADTNAASPSGTNTDETNMDEASMGEVVAGSASADAGRTGVATPTPLLPAPSGTASSQSTDAPLTTTLPAWGMLAGMLNRDWWPLIAAVALLLLLLIAWRMSRNARHRRRATSTQPRAITWSKVSTPEAQTSLDNTRIDYGVLALPSATMDMRMNAPPPSSAPLYTNLRHDSSRSAASRMRAIDAIVDTPLMVEGARPHVSRVSYAYIDLVQDDLYADPAQPYGSQADQAGGPQPVDEAYISLIEDELIEVELTANGAVNEYLGLRMAAPIEPGEAGVFAPRHALDEEADAALAAADAPREAMQHTASQPEPAAINGTRQPAVPPVLAAVAPTATVDAAERIGQAKHWLTADRPEQALASLAPLLDSGSANGEAWTVAGWSWWRIARDWPSRQLEAAGQAAIAFDQALRVEPARVNLLSRMIARCHQMQARHLTGAERLASLDEAIAVYDRHLQGHTRDDVVLLDWADALYERATASPRSERTRWLDRSERLIEQRWGTTMADAGEPVQWLWINLMLARAELLDTRAAMPLYERAIALLQAGIPRWDEAQRDAWLTRLIEVERIYAQHLRGASRISRLQATQASVEGWLASTRSANPLLAWIGLLGDWAASLHGAGAQAKLNEAEELFTRIEAISPEEGSQTRFARAYYLRLRARREFGLTRWHTLDQARALLAGIAPGELPQALIDLETAEIHLEQAKLTEGVPQQSHYALAARLAETAAQAPENEARALLCALTALVAISQSPGNESPEPQLRASIRMRPLANRLLDLAPHDAEALRIVASVHLASDEPQSASELCAAAWEAGAARAELMPIWREADARWARTLDPINPASASQDPHWKRLHQAMRMANSTL